MLYHVLQFKGEAKKVNIKNVEYKLYIFAHNGSGFNGYVVLNNSLIGELLLVQSKTDQVLFH